MEILQTILIILSFLSIAFLMFLRKIPAIIALPLMAVVIPVFAGVNFNDIIKYVIGEGTLKLSSAYTIAMFGSMLSVVLQKTGVAESFIKKGAELSGDNPWLIAVLMLSLIILLFSTLGGLGAIIMVATIVLPIMASVGIGPLTTVGIFLFGLSIGGTLNVGNWAVYREVMKLSQDQILSFALIMFSITFVIAIIYITFQLYKDGVEIKFKRIFYRSIVALVIIGGGIFTFNYLLPIELKNGIMQVYSIIVTGIYYLTALLIVLLFITAVVRAIMGLNENKNDVHWISYFTPIIPLLLILMFSFDFIAAFVVGLLYAFIVTYKKKRLNLFIRSIFEGGGVVMPAVILMFGIGMLLVAIMGPKDYAGTWPVLHLLKPLLEVIVPANGFSYVLIFALAAPLALYRGPLNVWGMGYGIAAVFLASGLNPAAVMGLLLSVGQIQGISDPTNTHNVWLANEMRVDVQKVLWNTLPYTWIAAIVGLLFSAYLFM
ncbi:MAG: citrate transporter [bacterium]